MIEDVQDIVKSLDREMQEDYVRISRDAKKDPGTAGDQGQANWQKLLQKWLPSYFKIVVNGKVVSNKSTDSPQVDIIVLRPEYPDILIEKKVFVAEGIVAMFECKTTLRRKDIKKSFENYERLSKHFELPKGTFRKELYSPFIYGMLCHSHEWQEDKSTPIENITKALDEYHNEITTHPNNMLDFICVADLAFWGVSKHIKSPLEYTLAKSKKLKFKPSGHTLCSYLCHAPESLVLNQINSPQGNMLSFLSRRLSWHFEGVKPLSQIFSNSGITLGGDTKRTGKNWEKEIFSKDVQRRACFGPFSNEIINDEWSYFFY